MKSIGQNFFGNESDADDVAQEGLVALWRYRDRLDAHSTHEGLAIRIAKHCCMDMERKRKEGVLLYGDIPPESVSRETSVALSPQEMMEMEELQAAVADAFNRLNPSEQRLYKFRELEGRGLDEIASETNIPKPSVKSIVAVARKKIFEELKKNLQS